MKLRIINLITVLILVLVTLAACSLTTEQKSNWSATGSYLAGRVGQIALNTVLNSAVNSTDRERKGDWVEGLAQGFRTQQGSLVTSGDVKALVDIWTPDAPHWQALGDKLATVYGEARPRTPEEAAKVLEGIAQGLELAETKAKGGVE